MARKPSGSPRGRPPGQTRGDHDFSKLVEYLFETMLAAGFTYEDAADHVAAHRDVVNFHHEHDAPAASRSTDAIQKRFQRALDLTWKRRRQALAGKVLPGAPLHSDAEPLVDLDPAHWRERLRTRLGRGGD